MPGISLHLSSDNRIAAPEIGLYKEIVTFLPGIKYSTALKTPPMSVETRAPKVIDATPAKECDCTSVPDLPNTRASSAAIVTVDSVVPVAENTTNSTAFKAPVPTRIPD